MTELQGFIARGIVLVFILVMAVHGELRTNQIKNPITLGGLVAALFVAAFTGRFFDALGGFLLVAVPLLFAFWYRVLPGGAVKLAMVLGACVGVTGALVIVLGTALVLAVTLIPQMRKPLNVSAKRPSSLWLSGLGVLGFALGAARLLEH